MALFEILIFAIVIIMPLYYFSKSRIKYRRIAQAMEKFQGPKWYPIFGTSWELINTPKKDLYEVLFKRTEKYRPIFRTWVGTLPILHLMKPEHMEVVLKSSTNITKGPSYDFLKPWLGDGLVTSTGRKWQKDRKLITPTFHFKILDTFTEVFSEKAQKLVQQLDKTANGEYFDICPYVTKCALDIICETAMGVDINAMGVSSPYTNAINEITEIFIERLFRPFLHSDIMFNLFGKGKKQKETLNILHSYSQNVIKERKSALMKNGNVNKTELSEEDKFLGKKHRKAFLDLLLESNNTHGEKLTDEELREQVDTFMFAGHDTTTGATCWTLFSIGHYPEIQKRVHQELDSVFHGEDRPITPDDIMQLQYLDRVIKEALRVHALIPCILRSLSEDIVLDGITVPAGVTLALHIANLHRDPEQFPDPLNFDPDRFLKENVAKRHPYSFIPFSAGPRNCIGQKFGTRNTKTILASILRKYEVKSRDDPYEIKCSGDVVLRPQNGIYLSLQKRIPE